MSAIPSLTILSEEQKFNGDNLLQWKNNITQLLGAKGLMGYIDGKIPKPAQSSTSDKGTPITGTPVYSTTPTLDEWNFRDQVTRGHITLNCTDVASLGVITTGTARDAWDSIKNEWGKSTDMRRSHAQEALNRTEYTEGTKIQDHIKLLRTRKAMVDNLSTESHMSDETWRGIIIRSIPPTPKWLPVIPSLYSMTTSADIVSTLLAHEMIILGREATTTDHSSPTTLLVAAQTNSEGCKNPNCKAKDRSTHTTENCYWQGGGKEGQFPSNFGQRSTPSKANITVASSSPSQQAKHFALSARLRVPETPGQSEVLIDEPDVSSVGEQIPNPLDTTTTIDTPTSILTDRTQLEDTETDTTTITDTPTLLTISFSLSTSSNDSTPPTIGTQPTKITISLSLSTPDNSSTPPTITLLSTKRTPFTVTTLTNTKTPTISAVSDPTITNPAISGDDQPATSIIPEGHCRSTWAPRTSTTGLQSMECRQQVSGRSDSNDNLNLIFNNPYDNSQAGDHNDDAVTNTSQEGESNTNGDGDCNENGGTQGGADSSSSGNDYDNLTDESSIPTSITTPSSAIANSTRDSPVENQTSNTPVATVPAIADSPTSLTMSATLQHRQILSSRSSSDFTCDSIPPSVTLSSTGDSPVENQATNTPHQQTQGQLASTRQYCIVP